MTPERWTEVKQTLVAALSRPPGDRAAYLEAIGVTDPELGREVEDLLAHQAEEEFLEYAAVPDVAVWGPAPCPGAIFGQYQIQSLLGEGGMGLVFLAQDRALDRPVALKFLSAALRQQENARRRFLREAKAAASLDHPYICKVYQTGEEDGHPFIAMEYVRGETLRRRLDTAPMPLKDVLRVCMEVAEALETAHAAQIVHRDLKPSNIMLTTGGHVKVLDFGLARRVGDEVGVVARTRGAELTGPGMVQGTVAYMSPEQVRGQEVDVRSDIFSLGVVVYESLTGRNPFQAGSLLETASQVLHHTPPGLRLTRPDLPKALEQVVQTMLARAPEARYQSVQSLRTELGRVRDLVDRGDVPVKRPAWIDRSARLLSVRRSVIYALLGLAALIAGGRQLLRHPDAGVSLPRSIAVLPFKPLVASESDERMQLGMTEALITRLSRIPTLRVEPLPRVRRYSALDQDPLQAGRELAVDAVVEGHFQRSDGSVHVRARVLRTADGTALTTNEWRESFSDIFEIHKGVAQSVMSALELTLPPAEHARVTNPDTTSPEAYRHYLFGRHLLEIRNAEQTKAASTEFREAVRLDPGYAAAHAALSLSLIHQAWSDDASGIEVMGPAKDAALKAIAIDGGLALAHSALARIHDWFDLDPVRAQREHVRAMEMSPQEPWVLRGYWYFLFTRNAFDEALELNARDLALDPTSPLANRYRAQTLFFARRYDECVAQSQRALSLDPRDLVLSHRWMATCLEHQGKQRDAVEMWERTRELGGDARVAEQLKRVYRERGWAAYWRERLRMAGDSDEAALISLRLGDLEDALRKLERLLERRNPNVLSLNHPQYDPLRSDPRFQALRQRAGVSDEINTLLRASRPPLRPASNALTR